MRCRPLRVVAGALVVMVCVGACDVGPSPRHRSARRSPAASSTAPQRTPSHDAGPATGGRLAPVGATSRGWTVARVVDGDTTVVSRGQRELTVRLIGIDTPETVAPGQPVMCFGPQATRFAVDQLDGSPVLLEFDRSQGRLDRYGRTLAYLWTGRPGRLVMFNRRAVRAGFAQEYTYDSAYAWQRVMRHAEGAARTAGRGLWAASTCNGDIEQPDDRTQ